MVTLALFLTLTLAATPLRPAPAAPPAPPALAVRPAQALLDAVVDVAWLRAHLHDAGLVVLHVGPPDAYARAHIPGARLMQVSAITTRTDTLALELPPVEDLVRVFEAFGVSDSSRIVLYWDADWVPPTTRVWFTLDRLGLAERASILDGGLAAWEAAGGTVTDEAPPPATPGRLTARPRAVTVEMAWLAQHLEDPQVVVVDTREPRYWDGSDAGSQPRAGRIPGARNVPYSSLIRDGRLLDLQAADRLLRAAGAGPGKRIVSYCHAGQQATVVYFAARRLGYDVRLYDGSFQQWSRHGELPVAR
jgi:thiosulfate/3-mercaptopyruvate sulfurtransferase